MITVAEIGLAFTPLGPLGQLGFNLAGGAVSEFLDKQSGKGITLTNTLLNFGGPLVGYGIGSRAAFTAENINAQVGNINNEIQSNQFALKVAFYEKFGGTSRFNYFINKYVENPNPVNPLTDISTDIFDLTSSGLDISLVDKIVNSQENISLLIGRRLLIQTGNKLLSTIPPDIGPDIESNSTEQTVKFIRLYFRALGFTEEEINALLASLQTVGEVAERSTLLKNLFEDLITRNLPEGVDRSLVDDIINRFEQIRSLNTGASETIIMYRVLQDSFQKFSIDFDKEIHAALSVSF
ncbi:MAG: hypothetical protein ACRCXT_00070 [Paraclostridium sp.]